MPPLLEFTDSLFTGTGHDLELRTFKVIDQYSGKTMGVRRHHAAGGADRRACSTGGVTRLCYCGSVLHTRPATPARARADSDQRRDIRQCHGAADVEVQALLCVRWRLQACAACSSGSATSPCFAPSTQAAARRRAGAIYSEALQKKMFLN
jgi:ATP phosphoribosyltransferase regulatory subunit